MSAEKPVVMLETTKGDITIELDAVKAPISTQNFLQYVEAGFYKNTIFHRVIPGFMIQGGGLLFNMKQKDAWDPIKNEAGNGLKNLRGTLAMARTSVVDSATAQFFINLTDNDFLDHRDNSAQGFGYAVFGRVTDGMDVVDAIAAVKTTSKGGHQDVPVEDITIKGAAQVE
jgi:cyclophilin family peptidyl-prolyl cis-trans isomerase